MARAAGSDDAPTASGWTGLRPICEDATMYDQPYLETCCRSALHRLLLCEAAARPPGLKDGACLLRLEAMGLARQRADGRYQITSSGQARHASEIVRGR